MDCAEFQKILPEYMEGGGSTDQRAHLRSCTVCSGLVQDLQYIAEAAKLLLPIEEPPSRVWQGIQQSLEKEGIVRPARGPERIKPFLVPGRSTWIWRTALVAVLAVLAVVALARYNAQKETPVAAGPAAVNSQVNDIDNNDQQLLAEVSATNPAMRATYEKSLRSVNSYISDARKSVEAHPGDADAREQLMQAYEQKAALYDMAMSRPGQ
ncbi:MAG: hypothetical protein L0Z53_17750 [Acidobacteriales bacterium]|nr:hypothetical protein [Terriglobales bacterium]